MGPNATAAHQQQLNEDNRQALVLFGIVFIFFVSNVPRILLNLHEVCILYDIVDMYFSNTFFGRSEKEKIFFFRHLLRFLLLETTKKTWLADVTIYLYGYMLVETYPNF